MNRMKIDFVISGLGIGGAEMMLLKLLSRMDRRDFEPAVFSLTDTIPLAERIGDLGIPVITLGMARGVPDPRGVLRLAARLRQRKTDLVQTWMYHADLIGGVAAKLAGMLPVVWNIRHSRLEPDASKKTTVWTARACSLLSRYLPEKIVCCAESAMQTHAGMGYDPARMVVIPNGFDLAKFMPDPAARQGVRDELGLPADSFLVGLFGRYHPQKDHRNFIQAAAILNATGAGVFYVLCGEGITWVNPELSSAIRDSGTEASFRLLGRRSDMPRLNAAMDIACSSSSSGEAFSNTVGEAMACETVCTVTDVGDSASIVGPAGKVVPPRDPHALAAAWSALLEMGGHQRQELGRMARQRVVRHFSLERIVPQYQDLYRELLAERRFRKKE